MKKLVLAAAAVAALLLSGAPALAQSGCGAIVDRAILTAAQWNACFAGKQDIEGGTSGGVSYFSSATTLASSGLLGAGQIVLGGGVGTAPYSTTTGTGVVTALGQSVTGSGGIVLATSPALTTPALGTPSAIVLTNATGTPSAIGLANGTGLPLSTGISGFGIGVATLLGGASSGTGGPAGTISPTFTGTVTGAAANLTSIGATTPGTGAFTTLSASGNLTTNVTGSSQCLQANSSGVVSGTGASCGGGVSSITGTASQIVASASTGAITLSLPSAIVAPGSLKTTTTLWQGGRNAYTHFGQLSPAGTTSSSPIMMGLGSSWKLTPSFSGRVRITVTGNLSNSTGTGVANVDCGYGTGTAPSNGAAATGTACSVAVNEQSVAGGAAPFTISFEASGLTLSTAYWFDLRVLSAISGSSSSQVQSVIIEEF